MRGIRKFLITTVVAMALGLLGLPPNLRADGGALKQPFQPLARRSQIWRGYRLRQTVRDERFQQ